MWRTTGLVSSGGGGEESVTGALLVGAAIGDGRGTRGGATGLGGGLDRGRGFAMDSVGSVESGRGAGVFGVGTVGRGVVSGARCGVEEVIGTAGVNPGLVMGSADSVGETASAGLGRGAGRRGRGEGGAEKGGVDIAVAAGGGVGKAGLRVARAVGAGMGDDNTGGEVEMAAGVIRAFGGGTGLVETGVVGPVIGLAPAGAAVAVAVVLDGLDGTGFTNVFEGASGGGDTSAFIFARARSAAARSVSAAQLFSTIACAMVSFMVCGRSTPGTVVIAGADMTRTSPRTVGGADVSELTSRSRRYRSMGCWLRERISS